MPNPDPPAAPTHPLLKRGLDRSSRLGFVRERLALLGKPSSWYCSGLPLPPRQPDPHRRAPFAAVVRGQVVLGHLCASLNMAVLWFLAAGPGRRSTA